MSGGGPWLPEGMRARRVSLRKARVSVAHVTEAQVAIRYFIPTSANGGHARFCHLRINYLPSHAEKDEFGRVRHSHQN